MILPPKVIHPTGEPEFTPKKSEISALIADTFNGKIHIEWDPQAQVMCQHFSGHKVKQI